MKVRPYFLSILSFLMFPHIYSNQSSIAADVAIVGPICFADGIGRQAIGMIDCLRDHCAVKFVHTRPAHDLHLDDVPQEVKRSIAHPIKGVSNVALFVDVLSNGNPAGAEYYYKKIPRATIKLAYSMFESTEIQAEWVAILNSHFDAAVVPDPFLVDVYKNSGVTIPVFVVPLGVYMDEFLKSPLKQGKNNPFVFGFSGSFTERKNHILILEAFAQKFGNDSNVRLRLHGRNGNALYQELILRVKELGLDNVEIICQSLSWQEYVAFMKSLDAYVSLSLGEGYGIPPREAMALGIPCILSDNTAHHSICLSGLVKSVPAPIAKPAYYDHIKKVVGLNFDCQLEDVCDALEDVYTNYDFYISQSNVMRSWAQLFLYENLRPYFLTLVRPATVVLGDVNKVDKECLTTSDVSLYTKYKNLRPVGK